MPIRLSSNLSASQAKTQQSISSVILQKVKHARSKDAIDIKKQNYESNSQFHSLTDHTDVHKNTHSTNRTPNLYNINLKVLILTAPSARQEPRRARAPPALTPPELSLLNLECRMSPAPRAACFIRTLRDTRESESRPTKLKRQS